MCNVLVKNASLYLEKIIYNNKEVICQPSVYMFINGWHPPIKIGTPQQGGAKF